MTFSPEALGVFGAGLALWRYYHAYPGAVIDASHYDIRAHFQGCDARGVMCAQIGDAEYMRLLEALRVRWSCCGRA